MGFLLMWVEFLLLCLNKDMYALKINAFAAICTVLSGEFLRALGKKNVFFIMEINRENNIFSTFQV